MVCSPETKGTLYVERGRPVKRNGPEGVPAHSMHEFQKKGLVKKAIHKRIEIKRLSFMRKGGAIPKRRKRKNGDAAKPKEAAARHFDGQTRERMTRDCSLAKH